MEGWVSEVVKLRKTCSALQIIQRAVVVVQLAEWSLLTPGDSGSNPVIGNVY